MTALTPERVAMIEALPNKPLVFATDPALARVVEGSQAISDLLAERQELVSLANNLLRWHADILINGDWRYELPLITQEQWDGCTTLIECANQWYVDELPEHAR